MRKWLALGAFTVAVLLGAFMYQRLSGRGSLPGGVEVTWDLLGQMDYITGHSTPELKSLDGKRVRIPGFMVPLEDAMKLVTEFLIVPTPQACVHVPPPPPNQMVFAKVVGNGQEVAYGAIWVIGTLRLVTKKHLYGESSFEIDVDAIEPYK